MIKIHPESHISPLADIEESVKGTSFELGAGSFIDSFVKIKPVGGLGDITIGKKCYINSGCVLYSGNGIKIGNSVSIAANCTFAPVNHRYEAKDIPIQKQGFGNNKGGILIGDDVWIGANCVILDGARIGKGVVVGASSLVSGVLDEYGIYAGNPLVLKGHRS